MVRGLALDHEAFFIYLFKSLSRYFHFSGGQCIQY